MWSLLSTLKYFFYILRKLGKFKTEFHMKSVFKLIIEAVSEHIHAKYPLRNRNLSAYIDVYFFSNMIHETRTEINSAWVRFPRIQTGYALKL